ncbi:glycosyltransferase family 4 protein [Rhizorhabdus sp. FW153]|uniref:glycosyltransferase family 4 protein n=1 Tax=Rhizorhabdus sp. FW153 TaxID=3400216 RepID=UPI003CEDE272
MAEQDIIWLVSRVFPPDEGGVQTYAEQVAEAYRSNGYRVRAFVKSSAGPRRITHGKLDIVDVGPGSKMVTYVRLFRAISQVWRTGERPAAIHACTWRAALAALPFPAPLVITVHGREFGRPQGAAFRLMRRVLYRAQRVVAVSQTSRTMLLERIPELAARCITAWNGTGTRAAAFQAGATSAVADRPQILTVCRLVPRKNVAAAIAAAASLLRLGYRFDYRIVGRGEDLLDLQALIDGLGAAASIRLLGYVPDRELRQLYAASDIFLHPQIALEDGAEFEGFGISVADAMANGLACIVGKDGGPSELVRDNDTGLIVDGRSVDAIEAAVEMLLRDVELRLSIGLRAMDWATRVLDWQRHCQQALGSLAHEKVAGEGVARKTKARA